MAKLKTKTDQGNPPAQGPQAKHKKRRPPPVDSKMRKGLTEKPLHPPQHQGQSQRLLNNLDPIAVISAEENGKPESQKDILNRLLSESFSRLKDQTTANKGVETIAAVVDRIQSGKPLKEMKGELAPLLAEQQAKINLLQAVMLNHDMELMALYADMRWRLVRALWEDLRAQKLSPVEKMTLLKMAVGEAESVQERIQGLNPNFTPMSELDSVNTTLDRVEKPVTDKATADKVQAQAGANPQSRDFMLKMNYKAKEAANRLITQPSASARDQAPDSASASTAQSDSKPVGNATA